jgi:hypothetical protein
MHQNRPKARAIPSVVAFRRRGILACFEFRKPIIDLFFRQVQAGSLVVIPCCESILA